MTSSLNLTPINNMSDPFVTFIIPMRNEEAWIERCLNSVLAQDWPRGRFEVLVADGMSDDRSLDILGALSAADDRVRVIENPGRIVPSGMNLAIREARGSIIARVDAHTIVEPDYLRRGVELLQKLEGAANVGGPMVCLGGSPVADAIAGAMGSRFGIGATFHFAETEEECDTVYMGMWPISVFEEVGLFDEELVRNQDDELSYRIRKAGGRIFVSPAMRSLYQNRESWKALLRQFYQYGVWKVRVLQKHPAQMSLRHFVPPGFQFSVLGLVLAGLFLPLFAALGFGLLGLYLAAMVAVAVREAPAGQVFRWWLAFVIIHQAWAAGFLVGLVKFAGRWIGPEPSPPQLSSSSRLG
jgi:succinoglycan biosynthesis protein ExoA